MMIRRESNLADLITGAGLLGSSHASETGSTTSIESTAEQQAPCRPCSAPVSRPNSSSRQLSRANSRAATISGLQASASRRSRNSSVAGGGATVVQEEWDAHPGQVKRSSNAKSGSLAWQEQQCAGDQTNEQALQHLQQHNQQLQQQLEQIKQQLQLADASQHNLEELLQQQASDHQAALQDLQLQHDNSSNKLFRELKATQAAKEQALSGRHSAEQATRDVQQELAAVQRKCQQQQQQLAALEERIATAARKMEQQAHAHKEASRRSAEKAERKLQQLKEQLAAKEMAIKAAEESLRQELHRRTGTILSMQAQLEQQHSALGAAAAQQAELQDKVQELQVQLTCPPTTNQSQAGNEQLLTDESSSEQHKNRQHGVITSQSHHISCAADKSGNCHAADAGSSQPAALGHTATCLLQRQVNVQQPHAADPPNTNNCNSSSLLNRQLQLPAGYAACSSTLPAAAEAQAVIADALQECRKSVQGSKSNSRPVSTSAQLLRQSLDPWEETAGASGAAAVKAHAGQVQALTAALATAAKDAADSKERYANNLAHLEAAVATAEASAALCWEAYDMTFAEMVNRVASLLKSQCEGGAVPFHRPRSAARHASRPGSWPVSASVAAPNTAAAAGGAETAASINAGGNESNQNTSQCSPNRRPVSAGTAGSCAEVVHVSASSAACDSRAESPGRQPYDSTRWGGPNSKRPQSAGAATWGWSEAGGKQQQQFSARPASAATHCSDGGASSSRAGGAVTNRTSGNSSINALNQMNQRLCDENAWLLVELGKWEAGHHQKQVALAAATKQQAHRSLMPGSNVASRTISSAAVHSVVKASSMAAVATAAANDDAHNVQSTSRSSKSSSNSSEDGSTSVVGREQASGSRELAGSSYPVSYSAGVPVNQALKLAIEEALQAQKGPVLPALLLSGLSAAAGGGSVGSSSGWAAAGSSRLVAALSAAEINMNLRTKVLQLESGLAHLKAAHAADDTHIAQQQQRIRQLEQQQQQLIQQLEAARLQAEESQESAQQCLQIAAAAVRQDGQASNAWCGHANHPDGTNSSHAHSGGGGGGGRASSSSSSAALVPGIAADDRLTCGGGYVRDLPVAAQQEIAAQRRIAAAAKRDKEVRSRELTQLEMRYSSLAAKLVKSRHAVSHKEGQIAQLQQALSAAHMALLDAGLEFQQQQGVLTATAAASAGDCGRQQYPPALAGTAAAPRSDLRAGSHTSAFAAAATAAYQGEDDRSNRDVMNVALSCEESRSSFCSSRLTGASSNASALGVNAAAAASWSAAMEARDRTKQIQRLTGLCADQQAEADSLKQELKKLQQQLTRQQRAADAALAAVQAEETSRRESLAGDLEGATTAMQEATRKLAASEVECNGLRQQLAAAERIQQQLELDIAYLRARRAGPSTPAQHSSATGTSSSVGTCSCCTANQIGSMDPGTDRSKGVKLQSVDAVSINVAPIG